MAVIWQKVVADTIYEVRTAGQTLRLYTNGVFHSQYNPTRELTGNVWDLLSLPAFFLAAQNIRRILVLGVGGGAVIRQLLNWFPDAYITGIELDKTHVQIGRRFFDLKHKQIQLIEADAIEWVKRHRGLPFDIIIEDIFTDQQGEPERVAAANTAWINSLSACLSSHGQLVMNFTENRDFKANAVFHDKTLQKRFKQVYKFSTPLYENNIAVMLQVPAKTNLWRKRILENKKLATEFINNQNKIRFRKVQG